MQYSCPSRRRIYYLETEMQSPCPACGTQLELAKLLKEWIPPHDTEAEAGILGAMLLAQEGVELAAGCLRPEDFYHPGHGDIFRAICEVYDSGFTIRCSRSETNFLRSSFFRFRPRFFGRPRGYRCGVGNVLRIARAAASTSLLMLARTWKIQSWCSTSSQRSTSASL
jgi:hypothetical protein